MLERLVEMLDMFFDEGRTVTEVNVDEYVERLIHMVQDLEEENEKLTMKVEDLSDILEDVRSTV